MSSWRLKQSSSRAFFSLLPGCHSFSSELARVGKLGKSLKIYGKFRGNPHGGLECLDIDGDITLHRMFRMFRYLRLRMFGKFRNHWVFFFTSPRAELKHCEISSTPQDRNLFSKPLGGASRNCPRWRPKRCWGVYFQKSPVDSWIDLQFGCAVYPSDGIAKKALSHLSVFPL